MGPFSRKFISFAFVFLVTFCPMLVDAQELRPGTIELEYRDDSTINHPCFTEQLDNGNLLFCRVGYRSPAVVEISPEGNEIWSFKDLQASSAHRLANGNTLIADSGAPGYPFRPRVIEVNQEGKVVWEYLLPSLSQSPRYVQRLASGNTLITLPFKIIEVSPEKKIVWSYGWGKPVMPVTRGYLANPVQAIRLANGNTLIVDSGLVGGRVLEITPQKDIVWQYGNGTFESPTTPSSEAKGQLKRPTGVLRLPDGNTLIADAGASLLLEVSPASELLGSFSWKDILTGLPVMNQWWAMPLGKNKVIVSLTLINSKSRIMIINR